MARLGGGYSPVAYTLCGVEKTSRPWSDWFCIAAPIVSSATLAGGRVLLAVRALFVRASGASADVKGRLFVGCGPDIRELLATNSLWLVHGSLVFAFLSCPATAGSCLRNFPRSLGAKHRLGALFLTPGLPPRSGRVAGLGQITAANLRTEKVLVGSVAAGSDQDMPGPEGQLDVTRIGYVIALGILLRGGPSVATVLPGNRDPPPYGATDQLASPIWSADPTGGRPSIPCSSGFRPGARPPTDFTSAGRNIGWHSRRVSARNAT
jgi:hypothetical protein